MFVPSRKLQPPSLPEPHLARQRLADALSGPRITCLIAPAGYGKTTALLEQWQRMGEPRAWYTLDAADRDPTLLLAGLAAALGAPAPEGMSAPSLGLAMLCRQLEALPAAALFLDDLHVLDGAADALRLLGELLVMAPPDLRLCLAGRSLPAIPTLPRLRLAGQAREVGPADLAFTPAESDRLLGSLGRSGAAAELHQLSQGWPVALRLLATVGAPERAAGSGLFEYLAAEVLAALPPSRRRFSVEAAVLSRWTPAACDFVLECQESQSELDWLRRSQLLVFTAEDGSLAPHPLWHEFLCAELRRHPQRHRSLQRRAALWATQRGEAEAALGHALAAADPGLIEPRLRSVVAELLRDGHVQRLQEWLQATPEAVLGAVPGLLLDVGEAMRRAGRQRWAVRWLQAAVLGYAVAGPAGGMLRAICRLASAHGDLGEWDEARAALRQVEAELPGAREPERAEALLALAEERAARGEWEEATAGFRQAAELFAQLGEAERAGTALVGLGARALAGAGQPEAALAALRQAAGSLGGATACHALLAEGQILLGLGRWQEAAAVLERTVPCSPPQQALRCWLEAQVALHRGDLLTAETCCRRGELCLSDVERTPALAGAALVAQGWLDQRSGNAGAALTAAARAGQLAAAAGTPLLAVAARELRAACQPPVSPAAPLMQAELLGTFRVRCGEEELPPAGRAQVRGLLQFLLLQPGAAAGREAILEAFWPEAPAEQSRGLLRVTLHRLRKVLQTVGCGLETMPDLVRLAPGSIGWIDLVAFRTHLAAAREAVSADPAACLDHCRSARALYRGDLLADAFWPWVDGPREQARRELIEILYLWQAAARHLQRVQEAVAALEELLALEPGREEAARELFRLLVESGRRAEALRHYRRLVRWLRVELGVEPAPETRAILRQLLG